MLFQITFLYSIKQGGLPSPDIVCSLYEYLAHLKLPSLFIN